MSQNQRLRVGAFGVGRMGQVHLENLVRLTIAGDIDLVAVGDRNAATLDSACLAVTAQGGIELAGRLSRFEQADRMAEEANLDAVVVASRTEDHARDCLAYVRHQIPVMVEKPLTNSVAEAVTLSRELGDSGNRFVQVALQRHFDPAAKLAKSWVSQGLIGQLQQSHHVLQDKNPTPPAYQSCGITADMAIHLIFEAICFHGFEIPRYVQALRFMAPHYEDRADEGSNVVHVFCSWPDGSLAHLWGSRINSTGYDNGFKLIGTEGRVDVGEFVGDFGDVTAKLYRGTSDDGPIDRGTLVEQCKFPMTRPSSKHPDFYARYAVAYAGELDAFLTHVRDGTPFELGPDIGWKTLLVANAAEKSSLMDGRRMELSNRGEPIETIDDADEFAINVGLD